ncbi:hypothetical protein, partial [Escherichia coli]
PPPPQIVVGDWSSDVCSSDLKIPFNDEWKLSINYTYNDGRDVRNGENKPLSDLPFHTRSEEHTSELQSPTTIWGGG